MARSKVYDLHIMVEDDMLIIEAYKLAVSPDGYFSTDTAKDMVGKFERKMSDKRNRKLVSYVLDSEHILEDYLEFRKEWDGYDTWQYSEYILVGDTPKPLKDWYEKLPEYDIRLESKVE